MKKTFFVIALLLISNIALASIPRYITVQGKLTDANDVPVTSVSANFNFSIYDDLTTGTLVWSEIQNNVPLNKGMFNTALNPPSNILFDKPYFLEAWVNGNKLSPRVNITSAGYAFVAGTLYVSQSLNMNNYDLYNASFVNASTLCLSGASPKCITNWIGGISGGGTLGYIPMWNSSSSLNNSVIYQSGGNVGIGTSSPTQKLDVNGSINASIYYDRTYSSYYLQPYLTSYLATVNIATQLQMSGPIIMNGNNINSVNDITASRLLDRENTAYYLDPASTGTSLNVAGDLNATGNLYTNYGQVRRYTGWVGGSSTDAGIYSNQATYWIRFVTNGGGFYWFSDSGTGTNPIAQLSSNGNLQVNGNLTSSALNSCSNPTTSKLYADSSGKIICGTDQSGSGGGLSGGGTLGYISMWNSSSSLNNSVIYQLGGNVGIGTASPGGALDVNGRAGATSFKVSSSFADLINNAPWYGIGFSSLNFWPGQPAGYNVTQVAGWFGLNFQTANGQMVINGSSGYVGIGTTSPTYTLDVNGTFATPYKKYNKIDKGPSNAEISLSQDINRNGVVDIYDLGLFKVPGVYGCVNTNACWNKRIGIDNLGNYIYTRDLDIAPAGAPDGKIDILDVVAVSSVYENIITPYRINLTLEKNVGGSPLYQPQDINKDGFIDSADVTLLFPKSGVVYACVNTSACWNKTIGIDNLGNYIYTRDLDIAPAGAPDGKIDILDVTYISGPGVYEPRVYLSGTSRSGLPAAEFTAADGSNNTNAIVRIINADITPGEGHGLLIQAGNGASDLPLEIVNKAGTELFRVRGDGSVGIGTSIPDTALTITVPNNANAPAIKVIQSGQQNLTIAGQYGSQNIGVANGYYISTNSGSIGFGKTGQNANFLVNYDGNVGIGTTTPAVPLDIGTSASLTASYGYLNSAGATGTGSGTNSYSIRVAQRILATEFNANSDKRIKQIIGLSNTTNDLETIKKLNVTVFKYIDTVANGNETKKGFIAQDVKEIMPEAVKYSSDFIPDIYSLASKVEYNEESKTLAITVDKPHNLKEGDKVRLITMNKTEEKIVSQVIYDKIFVVSDWDYAVDKVFVYGKYVNDVMTLDYDRIFTTAVGAVQEQQNHIEQLKAQNDQLVTETEQLKSSIQQLQQRLEIIESKLNL